MEQRIAFKRIKDEETLQRFQEETARRINVTLPMEYLSRSRVVALISEDKQKIYGGYVIADNGPLRSLQQIPQDFIENNQYLNRRIKRCFEINGLWLDHDDAPRSAGFGLYLTCFFQVIKQAMMGRIYFIYSYDASKKRLANLYAKFRSTQIFHGEVKALPGMSGPGEEIIEIGSLNRVIWAALITPEFFVHRLKRWRSKRKEALRKAS